MEVVATPAASASTSSNLGPLVVHIATGPVVVPEAPQPTAPVSDPVPFVEDAAVSLGMQFLTMHYPFLGLLLADYSGTFYSWAPFVVPGDMLNLIHLLVSAQRTSSREGSESPLRPNLPVQSFSGSGASDSRLSGSCWTFLLRLRRPSSKFLRQSLLRLRSRTAPRCASGYACGYWRRSLCCRRGVRSRDAGGCAGFLGGAARAHLPGIFLAGWCRVRRHSPLRPSGPSAGSVESGAGVSAHRLQLLL